MSTARTAPSLRTSTDDLHDAPERDLTLVGGSGTQWVAFTEHPGATVAASP